MVDNKKKAFVLGMARSGYEAAKFLISKGYDVTLNDSKAEQAKDQMEELESLGVKMNLGSHPDDLFDDTFDIIVKNPGIPNDHKYVVKAHYLNIPVINEVELAFRYFNPGVKIVGVTGTNGKTTTTTIIYEILKFAGKSAYLMGNIGYPICSFVSKLEDGDIAVMEISDHQLCNLSDFKTDISVLTNLSEAHLDFHGSYTAYKEMKKRIFNHHDKSDIAILNLDDSEVLDLTKDINSTKKYFSSQSPNENGCSIVDGYISYNDEKIINVGEIKVKGMHNYENVMAAIVVVKEFDVSNEVIVSVLKSFGGVEHRIEYVNKINNREFYNDSKATNVTSTQIALSSFTKPTILLLGGLDRGHSFDELEDYLKHVKLIVAYGETRYRINDFANEHNIKCGNVETLEEATNIAYEMSEEGDVILLSPACASWDQFKSFEIRGKMFKEYVNKL
ncbi:MAG: UDP-N-acetylmuramoyl-L-alanine--D-glutamate ligase [Bacilli bacterium]|nr:UDP-N-acetylmuramoyl-L-alanine--D-glutamate ligase [Bacilli bacterium]MDD4053256.1 UDP-N-acetylmuramoyl-L-alanine--D-glutamate ligase [Bacilli bacterium]MDD4411220.1 UDP-N-acetylmuramoyl-L-alanine--D-glutamate ligase [Bacilli bacterium]